MIVPVCVVLGFKHTIVIRSWALAAISRWLIQFFQRSRYPIVVNDGLKRALMQTQGVRHAALCLQGILKTDDDFSGVRVWNFDSTFIHQNYGCGQHSSTFSDKESANTAFKSHCGETIWRWEIGFMPTLWTNRECVLAVHFGHLRNQLETVRFAICFTDLYHKQAKWQPEQCSGQKCR